MSDKEKINYVRLAKTHRPFFFKNMSREEMQDILNNKYPINLKYNEDLIDKVSARYPLLNKNEITIIIKIFFKTIRDLLILGKVLSFDEIFINAKLFVFKRFSWWKKKNVASIKLKMHTSKNLRAP